MATTADAVEFFDRLFDSVNGRPGDGAKEKLRTVVKRNTKHIPFWREAKKKLSNIKFVDRNGKHESVQGWITTIESFLRVSSLLFDKYKVKFFYPRFLNIDPLENYFGQLRALIYRNGNPDANTFVYTFKSLVLSSLSPVSKFSNCEEDTGEQIFTLDSKR